LHEGEFLYPVPNEISVAQFAEACGVTDKHMHAIVSGRAPRLTAYMAVPRQLQLRWLVRLHRGNRAGANSA